MMVSGWWKQPGTGWEGTRRAGAHWRDLKGLAVVVWAVGLLALGVGFARSESDFRLVLVPRADVLETTDFDTCRGFELGPGEVLVMLSGEEFTRLKDRLALAEPGLGARGAGPAGASVLLGPKPEGLLWVTAKPIPADVALEVGIRVIYAGPRRTLFEASRDNAFRMLEKGYLVSEVCDRPLADLKQPHFGRDLTEALLAERPVNEARLQFMTDLAESVSADSLRNAVYFLTYDEAGARYRSRFAPRYELQEVIEPYLWDRFNVCPSPACSKAWQGFVPYVPSQYAGGDPIWYNLILDKRGSKTRAHYIVCAHYDAIAVRESGWNWETDAAPGADDNATGVAALLECARLIAPLDLDVGVTFIAFAGEELFLQGSQAYADLVTSADSVLGVINLDMLGYVAGSRRTDLTYDVQSEWLSDRLLETASVLDPSIGVVTRDQTGIGRSDQASFWKVRIPGVMLSDIASEDGDPLYPYYHTLADTLGQLDIDQVRDNTRLAVAYLARFAEVQAGTLSDLELTDGGVEWKWDDRGFEPFVAGDSLTAIVRAVNVGGSMTEPERYSLRIWQGDRWTGRQVHEGTQYLKVVSGGYAEVTASWETPEALYGDVPYTFALRPVAEGVESDTTNNIVMISVQVMSQALVLRDLHVYPNPVTDPAGAKLAFEILLPENDFAGELDVGIFDLEGHKVGGALLKRSHIGDKDIAIGRNVVDLDQVLAGAWDLPPGLYICLAELKIVGGAGGVTARSKFAVAR